MRHPQSRSMVDFAREEIKQMILQKTLKPGQHLAEITLSQRLQISRTPIREALRELCNDGWVTIIPNKGVWVASPSQREVRDTFEMRTRLECWATYKAAFNVTAILLTQLRECLEKENKIYNTNNHERYFEANEKFHLLIAEASGNSILNVHVKILLSKTMTFTALHDNYFDFPKNPSLNEHTAIVDALERRDTNGLIRLMKRHLGGAGFALKLC